MKWLRDFCAWAARARGEIVAAWWEIFRVTVIVSLCAGTLSDLIGVWPAQLTIVVVVPLWLAVRLRWKEDKK